MAFLGIDLGTGGVRALLIDRRGAVLGEATAAQPLYNPAPGWMEQDPEDWWQAACAAVRRVVARAGVMGDEIEAIGTSGQMHGATLLDATGGVVRRCILWNDQRSVLQCSEITRLVGAERLQALTGNVALAGFTAPKLLWVRDNEPQNWARTAHVLLPRDYLNYRMSGTMASEPSDAAGTLLFDVRKRTWSVDMLAALDIPAALLPPVVDSADMVGTVTALAAQQMGLREGTPVIAGGADNACAAAGCGVLEPGQVLCSIGTSGTVLAPVPLSTPSPGHNVHLFNHVTPRANYLMGVVLSAGGALRWFRDSLCPDLVAAEQCGGPEAYSALTAEAATVPAGAEGLLFLPYLTGERTPLGSAAARGVFFGLSPHHTRKHLARAVLEGVSYALGESLDLLRSSGVRADTVRLTGGGARSPLWRGILASVFDCGVVVQAHDEGPAYGAALLAAVGAAAYSTIEEAGAGLTGEGLIAPDPAAVRQYRQTSSIYRSVAATLRPEFDARMRLDGPL